MNVDNLHELINRYEENYYLINNKEHDEIFKWKALKGFRDVWFDEKSADKPFAERFSLAMRDSSILINNSMISPTSGVVKLAEEYPHEVESLFSDTLFCDETRIDVVQDNMERFLDEMEKLRQSKYPRFYRYKQERHSASCYLFFFNPNLHFIYRYSDAEEFAKYIEFGKDLGSGDSFSLVNYYEMANLVVEALKEHASLLSKYEALLRDSDDYFHDDSLHLMAFDLMYCSRCYNFFSGLSHIAKKESIKEYSLQMLREAEEKEKAEKAQALENEIHALKIQMDQYADISLINVEVTQKTYGVGIIIGQERNKITVKFDNIEKVFMIHKKYSMRPTFENDTEVVEAFTVYSDLYDKVSSLESELKRLYEARR